MLFWELWSTKEVWWGIPISTAPELDGRSCLTTQTISIRKWLSVENPLGKPSSSGHMLGPSWWIMGSHTEHSSSFKKFSSTVVRTPLQVWRENQSYVIQNKDQSYFLCLSTLVSFVEMEKYLDRILQRRLLLPTFHSFQRGSGTEAGSNHSLQQACNSEGQRNSREFGGAQIATCA